MMNQLKEFMQVLTGQFDNIQQYEEKKSMQLDFPYARHVNTACNDKIKNLPANFTGIFRECRKRCVNS